MYEMAIRIAKLLTTNYQLLLKAFSNYLAAPYYFFKLFTTFFSFILEKLLRSNRSRIMQYRAVWHDTDS
jgi:hypothetical protein